MPYALACANGELVAALAGGRILRSRDSGETWSELDASIGPVLALAMAEG